jgi:hypothetical protein
MFTFEQNEDQCFNREWRGVTIQLSGCSDMINKTLVLLIIVSAVIAAAQNNPTAKTSLANTIIWITQVSAAHRILVRGGDVDRAGPISSPERCTIVLDMSVPRFEQKWSVNHLTATVKLSRIRHISWQNDAGQPSRHAVRLRSGHSELAIEEVIETSEGLTTTTRPITLDLLLDSGDAAVQFAHAVSHAVSRCGGKTPLR